MKFELFPPICIHEIGTRDNQEDSIWPHEPSAGDRLFVLCDGMGGHEHGEVASQTVTKALGQWLAEHIDSNAALSDDQLREAIEFAYTQLDQYADDNPKQMGTTLTLIYLGCHGVTACHMGDSRIYHIRPNEAILYISRDHSLVFDLYQSGEINYDEMKNFKQKNIVTRAMTPGEDHRMRPDIIHISDVKPGDYFYMCSDGMLEDMTDNELFSILSSDTTDDEKRLQMINATSANKDNHSAWLIQIKNVEAEEGDDQLINEEPTSRCNALNITPPPPSDDENDVKIANEDEDVVLISAPKKANKQQSRVLRIMLSIVALLFVIMAIWFFFLKKESPKAPEPPQSEVMHKPITGPTSEKKEIDKETESNEPARN